MSNGLEITDLSLGQQRPADPEKERTTESLWRDLTITVKNNSGEQAYYVVSDIRKLEYDPATRTLSIQLREQGGGAEPAPSTYVHYFVPKLTRVGPGESAVIQVSVPVVIHKIKGTRGLGLDIEQIDTSQAEHLNCTVAYDSAPIEAQPQETAAEVKRRAVSWGNASEKSLNLVRKTSN